MKYTVRELPKALADKRSIVRWLAERSLQGAASWLAAYDRMIERLAAAADSFSQAIESRELEIDVRQVLFRTHRGRVDRALFHVVDAEVFILRVRGPGQAPIIGSDLTE